MTGGCTAWKFSFERDGGWGEGTGRVSQLVMMFGPFGALGAVVMTALALLGICLLRANAPGRSDAPGRADPPPRRPPAVAPPAPSVPSTPEHPTASEPALRRLSTAQLCHALRRSYAPTPGNVLDLNQVRRRGELLDELERRDPAGFSRWLATEPSVGSDPGLYLTPGQR